MKELNKREKEEVAVQLANTKEVLKGYGLDVMCVATISTNNQWVVMHLLSVEGLKSLSIEIQRLISIEEKKEKDNGITDKKN
jgi:hypothetical protein